MKLKNGCFSGMTIMPYQQCTRPSVLQPQPNQSEASSAITATTTERCARAIQVQNVAGQQLTIEVDTLAKALPDFDPTGPGQFEAVVTDSGWILQGQGVARKLVTPDGMVYQHRSDSRCCESTEFKCNEQGQPLSNDGEVLPPCARIISVGDGHLVCAPPGIHLAEQSEDEITDTSDEHTGLSRLTHLAIAVYETLKAQIVSPDPIVAECSWLQDKWVFLEDLSTGSPALLEHVKRDIPVSVSITEAGRLILCKELECGAASGLFPWQRKLKCEVATTQGEFARLNEELSSL